MVVSEERERGGGGYCCFDEGCLPPSWFYLADRTSLLPRAGKLYSRDVFAFLCLAIAAAAAAGGTVAAKAPSLLNRHQTEEWKGWMQVRKRGWGRGKRCADWARFETTKN